MFYARGLLHCKKSILYRRQLRTGARGSNPLPLRTDLQKVCVFYTSLINISYSLEKLIFQPSTYDLILY